MKMQLKITIKNRCTITPFCLSICKTFSIQLASVVCSGKVFIRVVQNLCFSVGGGKYAERYRCIEQTLRKDTTTTALFPVLFALETACG